MLSPGLLTEPACTAGKQAKLEVGRWDMEIPPPLNRSPRPLTGHCHSSAGAMPGVGTGGYQPGAKRGTAAALLAGGDRGPSSAHTGAGKSPEGLAPRARRSPRHGCKRRWAATVKKGGHVRGKVPVSRGEETLPVLPAPKHAAPKALSMQSPETRSQSLRSAEGWEAQEHGVCSRVCKHADYSYSLERL